MFKACLKLSPMQIFFLCDFAVHHIKNALIMEHREQLYIDVLWVGFVGRVFLRLFNCYVQSVSFFSVHGLH